MVAEAPAIEQLAAEATPITISLHGGVEPDETARLHQLAVGAHHHAAETLHHQRHLVDQSPRHGVRQVGVYGEHAARGVRVADVEHVLVALYAPVDAARRRRDVAVQQLATTVAEVDRHREVRRALNLPAHKHPNRVSRIYRNALSTISAIKFCSEIHKWTHPDGDVGEVTQHRRRDEHVDARDGRHDDDLDLGASVADAVVDAHVQDVHRRFV